MPFRPERLLVAQSIYADDDRIESDPGSMVDEHPKVDQEVCRKALADLGALSLFEAPEPERTKRLIAIAKSMYPQDGA